MMSSSAAAASSEATDDSAEPSDSSPDDLFSEFRKLCQQLEVEPSYNAKTKIVSNFIKHGSSGGVCSISLSLV